MLKNPFKRKDPLADQKEGLLAEAESLLKAGRLELAAERYYDAARLETDPEKALKYWAGAIISYVTCDCYEEAERVGFEAMQEGLNAPGLEEMLRGLPLEATDAKAKRLEAEGRFEDARKTYLDFTSRAKDTETWVVCVSSAARISVKMKDYQATAEYANQVIETAPSSHSANICRTFLSMAESHIEK